MPCHRSQLDLRGRALHVDFSMDKGTQKLQTLYAEEREILVFFHTVSLHCNIAWQLPIGSFLCLIFLILIDTAARKARRFIFFRTFVPNVHDTSADVTDRNRYRQ